MKSDLQHSIMYLICPHVSHISCHKVPLKLCKHGKLAMDYGEPALTLLVLAMSLCSVQGKLYPCMITVYRFDFLLLVDDISQGSPSKRNRFFERKT